MFNYKKLFFLDSLNDAQKEQIISLFKSPVFFKGGEVIYSPERFYNALGFVCSGSAFAISNNSSEIYMQSFSAGDSFGAAAIFGGNERYVSTIIAKTDAYILFISEEELKNIFSSYPAAAVNYIEFLSNKVRYLNKKLNLISCRSCEDTLYKYLCSAANDDGDVFIKNYTLLAKALGQGRATLYRCLDTLIAQGLIIKQKNIIKVIKNEKNY